MSYLLRCVILGWLQSQYLSVKQSQPNPRMGYVTEIELSSQTNRLSFILERFRAGQITNKIWLRSSTEKNGANQFIKWTRDYILERFRDWQTTNTNTCGWAVFLHVDFRFRDEYTDKTNTNTNTTSSAGWNLVTQGPRQLSRTLRVCRLTAVVYEYTLRLSSRHFFTAVKSEDNVWRNLSIEAIW